LSNRYLLGIDVGTTSTKAVIVDLPGSILAKSSSEHELIVPRPGWAEEDPAAWWRGLISAVKQCLAQSSISAAKIAGIGISGQIPTMVMIDEKGKPTRNAILYSDSRAVQEMKWMRDKVGDDEVFRVTGYGIQQQLWIPKLLWVKRHDPLAIEKAHKIIGAYDYLKMKLTGEFSTDLNNALEAGLLDFRKSQWWTTILEVAGIDSDLLPDLRKPPDVIGEVSKVAADETGLAEGTPVVAGSGDTVCSALSAGVVESNEMMLMYGTTGCFVYCTKDACPDPRFYFDYHVIPGMYALNGCMATSGMILRWFRDNFCREELKSAETKGIDPYAILDQEAETVSAGSEGIVILPYFMGEKTPVNDPLARGVILGLTTYHSRAHVYRALLEAVAYGFNHQLQILRELGHVPKRVVAVNGGAKSRLWRQIVTDVIGFNQDYVAKNPGAPLGDAFLAGIGTREIENWDSIKEWLKVTDTAKPNPVNHDRYVKMFAIYRSVYEHLKQDFIDLAAS
jgi:xylulokinase